jgi:hypothetical protein
MQIYQKCIFWGFHCFLLFFYFSEILSKIWVKNWVATDAPLFTMLTKQKFLNVLHSKLVKKTKGLFGFLSDPFSQGLHFLKENGLIIWGDLPLLKKNGLFSRATCPHTLTLVYFHGQPAHTYLLWSIFRGDLPTHSLWSIFRGDLPTHTHTGLFSRVTCPHILIVVYFQGQPAHTYSH